jgi:hypothetical protein
MTEYRHCSFCEMHRPHNIDIQQIIHTTERGTINKTLELATCQICKNTYSKRVEPVKK